MERALNGITALTSLGAGAGAIYGTIFGPLAMFLGLDAVSRASLTNLVGDLSLDDYLFLGSYFGMLLGLVIGLINGFPLAVISVIFFRNVSNKIFYRGLLAVLAIGITFVVGFGLLYEGFLIHDMQVVSRVCVLLCLIALAASQHLCWWFLKHYHDSWVIPLPAKHLEGEKMPIR
jgi:hypothetical protein